MKTLLIGLLALVITLGVACKKETIANDTVKTEIAKPVSKADAPIVGIGGYPGGQYVFPHNTGICYCGAYSTCHPYVHTSNCKLGQIVPGTPLTSGCTCQQ